MPRLPRFDAPGFAHHVLQRGHNGEAIFLDAADYTFFLDCLARATRAGGIAVHAYVLMPDHVHLLVTPSRPRKLARAMQSVGTRFVRYMNRKYERQGTLWEGRYRCTVLDDYDYVLACYRYIELNPVRNGLVTDASDWPYSSFHRHAYGQPDGLITDHDNYRLLGRTSAERQSAYRSEAGMDIPEEQLERLRAGTHSGWAVGSAPFKRRVEAVTKRRADPKPRGGRRPGAGRPRKPADGGESGGDCRDA